MASDVIAFLKWYLAVSALGLLALPAAFKFFRRLPDRGFAFARSLGLMAVCYVFWLLGSLGFLRNDVPGLLSAAAMVGGLGLWWLGRAGLADLRGWLRGHLGVVLGVEAVFVFAFVLMACVRAYNGAIFGTEKPMEFMFINSILRSPSFPPNDAWLSGHAISYYYFGYVMVASLARLTATPSAVAFNLGLALLFALTAVGSLGVGMNLIALVKEGRGKGEEAAALRPSSFFLRSSFWPALLAPLLALVVGNFYGPLALAHGNGLFADVRIPALRYSFGELKDPNQDRAAIQSVQDFAELPGVKAEAINLWEWLDLKELGLPLPARPAKFNWSLGAWFFAARVVHDRNLTGVETEAIDEMPAFSFVLGDMHPHVLALPFAVLAVALALEWLLSAGDGRGAPGDATPPLTAYWSLVTRHLSLVAPDRLLLSALLLGGLSFLNTWDFPIYWFLTAGAFVAGLGLRWGWGETVRRWVSIGLTALALAALSVLLYLPFYLTFQSQAGGLLPNLIYPTRFHQLFVFFGPTLVGATLFLGWLAARGRATMDWGIAQWSGPGGVALLILAASALAFGASLNLELKQFAVGAVSPFTLDQALRLTLQRRLVDGLSTLFPALMMALAAGLGVGLLRASPPAPAETPAEASPAPPERVRPWRRRRAHAPSAPPPSAPLRSPAVLMALVMILTGALLVLGPEYVYLRDNFGTRMNTIFKFYFQAWVLWALVSAFGLWYVAQYAGRAFRWSATGVMGLAVAGGLLYTLPAVNTNTGGFAGPPTLDGMAYFARNYPDDWAAIQWLQTNVPDVRVVAEAVGGAYNVEESRVAMATGLPTVMGWTNHEGQWRGAYYTRVGERPSQIQTLYQVRDWSATQAILDAYQIEYVYVGATERRKYNPIYLPKFEQNMMPVFRSGQAVIYRRMDAGGLPAGQ
jgi:YYY domain-containing protein